MNDFMNCLINSGYTYTVHRVGPKEFKTRNRYANKRQVNQRVTGFILELQEVEAYFNVDGILETIEPK